MHDASYFDREYFELHPGKVKYLRWLVGLLRRHGVASGRVLDVGAGYGFLLEALAAAGYDPHGLEVSEHAADVARQRTGAPVARQSAEEPFPYEEGFFHAVILHDVIEHLQGYGATLAECRRVLRRDGRAFVVTLNAHSAARPLLGRRWAWHQDPTHVHMFSPEMLRQGLIDAGLAVERLVTISNFCSVGEGTAFLKPLRVIGRVVTTPALGDSLLAVGRKA